ncbi:chorismate mutase [Natranaerobius trueperi]|uniref:chorismate mutase n=1 Tax=Natranaerobius trueperi TaxID=759412 RepID=A0A226BXS7_9FIRM|nr:chorismate mutase [Natranaerobius trueperi]OWZ82940.1 chorismate mutase [Natranaerobius trueperi]
MNNLRVHAVRGATTTKEDSEQEVLKETKRLLESVCDRNQITDEHQVISIFFTTTKDLQSCFPARAARKLGWTNTALMCAQEIDVEGAITKCIRIMIHYYSHLNHKPEPVYLNEAQSLRPDLNK